jgi:hypothetical protein
VWTAVATDRGSPRARVTSSHQRIYNNILFANHSGAIGLPFPFDRAEDNLSDANLFIGGGAMDADSTGVTFRYHSSHKRVPEEKIVDAFARALDKLPPGQRPNLKLWSQHPDLTLYKWRLFSQNDRNSVVTRLSDDMLGLHTLEVRFNFLRRGSNTEIDELWKVRTVPVAGIEADFFGIPLPKDPALPGPFQNVVKGPNRWFVWPVRPLLKGYPLEPGETPHAETSFGEAVRVRHGCSQPRRNVE